MLMCVMYEKTLCEKPFRNENGKCSVAECKIL